MLNSSLVSLYKATKNIYDLDKRQNKHYHLVTKLNQLNDFFRQCAQIASFVFCKAGLP